MAKRPIEKIQGRKLFGQASAGCLDTLSPTWKVVADVYRRHISPEDGVWSLAALTFVSEEVGEDRYERAGRKLVAEIREKIVQTLPHWDRLGPLIRAWLKKRGVPEAQADCRTATDLAVHTFLLHAHALLTIYSDPVAFFQRQGFDAFGADIDETPEPERRLMRLALVLNRWGFAAIASPRVRAEFDRLLATDPTAFHCMIALAEERAAFTDQRPVGTKNRLTQENREEIARIAEARKVPQKRLVAIGDVLRAAGFKVSTGMEKETCTRIASRWKRPPTIDPDDLEKKARPIAEKAVWKEMGRHHRDAPDAIQDSIIKVVQKPPRSRDARSIAAYVWKTATNIARDYRKKHNPRSERDLTETAIGRNSIERFEGSEPRAGEQGDGSG